MGGKASDYEAGPIRCLGAVAVIPELREQFNRQWTPASYQRFRNELESIAGTPVGFRCLETPVFLPRPLLDKMVRYGRELYGQLASNAEYHVASDAAIPMGFKVRNEPEHPLFLQADFGLIEAPDGSLEPKLVEIQGFPSIYAFQAEMAQVYERIFRINETYGSGLSYFLDGLNETGFRDLMSRAILGNHAPEEVVLLEVHPCEQKTLCDFLATQRLLGIKIASATEVEKRGRKLFFEGVEVKRIYNRVIADELLQKNIKLQFEFCDDLDVEWAGNPNWFFRLSKFSLPWFRHVCVPQTWFLHQMHELPANLDAYVLKPLYSFAGRGVTIAPSRSDIEAIPMDQRSDYILQERMNFVPTIATPEGMTKVEVRIMYIRDGDEYRAVNTVVRTGRGKMMGVDFNRNLTWVGASAGFSPA